MLRRKLAANLLFIVICGAVALSLPVLIQSLQKSAAASGTQSADDWTLVSIFVGDRHQDKVDSCVVWQIQKQRGDIVITWDEIYAAITKSNPLTYTDTEHLTLTSHGIVYRGIRSAADYQILLDSQYTAKVTYQGLNCTLQLP